MTESPRQPGTYVLILRLDADARIDVGRLGTFAFPAGFYAYAGSACGPGGLAGRLRHHMVSSSRAHWHVDYLRRLAQPLEVWLAAQALGREHGWAALLGCLPAAGAPAARFGASDCRCPTHLWHWPGRPPYDAFRQSLSELYPGDPSLERIELEQ